MADPLGPCILAVLFLFLAAIVCALNAALPSVDEDDARARAKQGDPAAQRLARLLDRYDRGRGDFRMAFALLMSASAAALLSWAAPAAAEALNLPVWLCSLVLLIVYAVLAMALALIVPGSAGAHAPEGAIRLLAAPGECILRALTPVMLAAYGIGYAILRPLHIRPGGNAERVTEKEIRMMMELGEEEGAIESDKKEMIENIFEFNSMDASDCMVHRRDITAIDADAAADEVLATIAESGLSRFPVYEEGIDNVIGVLTSRDFLLSRCRGDERPVRALIRPPYLVPESVRTDVLFREMQTQKQHMAIVIDEYGRTSGLITLEDLLENLGDRRITLCRELTKKHETVFLSTLSGALEYYRDQEPRGECVIVMEGRSREEMREEERRSWEEMDIREHMDLYLSRGMDQKAAMKAVAKDRRIGKRDVYRMVLEGKES